MVLQMLCGEIINTAGLIGYHLVRDCLNLLHNIRHNRIQLVSRVDLRTELIARVNLHAWNLVFTQTSLY